MPLSAPLPAAKALTGDLAGPADVTLGHQSVQRWNLPDGWVISARPAHPALVSEDDFIAAQDVNAARGPAPAKTRPCRKGDDTCWPGCWPAGHAGGGWKQPGPTASPRAAAATATPAPPARTSAAPKNAYVREDRILPQLPALHVLLTSPVPRARRRTRHGADVRPAVNPKEVIGYPREHQLTLTWDPAAGTVQVRAAGTAKTVTLKAS